MRGDLRRPLGRVILAKLLLGRIKAESRDTQWDHAARDRRGPLHPPLSKLPGASRGVGGTGGTLGPDHDINTVNVASPDRRSNGAAMSRVEQIPKRWSQHHHDVLG